MRLFSLLQIAFLGLAVSTGSATAADTPRPNILWLTSEDHGPHMGCYGDKNATTPNIDALAAKGMIYMHAWSNAPVCTARSTIISGMYPPATGAEHMRSMVAFPLDKKMFPQYLREAGYYCTNNSKEDYNLAKPGRVWDESSLKAHWRGRKGGEPFFAVFNSLKSHESQIRTRPHQQIHDPAQVRLPAYHPDTPEVRQDSAQYYDKVTQADADAGKRLKELADDGLADDTIVFYYADHGSGMPRSKRWPYDSGLHVPLVVFIPEKFKHLAPPDYKPGGRSDRLVSFVDLAPTVLSLAGLQPPFLMHGRAFLGKYQAPTQPYLYGFRGRMDERQDMVRSATDGRFVYVRNYMPHKVYGQYLDYMFQTPTTRVWKKLHDQGKLTPVQDIFWHKKPPEELYDLQTDPDEVANLASDPKHVAKLEELRKAQRKLAFVIRDVGFLPEGEIHSRSVGSTPYEMGHTEWQYPFERIFDAAEAAASLNMKEMPALLRAMRDEDSAVRYWGAMGILMREKAGVAEAHEQLRTALKDQSPYVRIAAAEALGRYGDEADLNGALDTLVELGPLDKNGVFVAMAALNAVQALEGKAASVLPKVKQFPVKGIVPDPRYSPYMARMIDDLTGDKK